MPAELPRRHLPAAIPAAIDPFEGLGLQLVAQVRIEAGRARIQQMMRACRDSRTEPLLVGISDRKPARHADVHRSAKLIQLALCNPCRGVGDALHFAERVDDAGPVPEIIAIERNAVLPAGDDPRADLLDVLCDPIENVTARQGRVGQALMDDARRIGIHHVPVLGGEFRRLQQIFQRVDQAASGQRARRVVVEPAGIADAVPMQVGREEDRRMSRNHARLLVRSPRLSCNCVTFVARSSQPKVDFR
ncbi:hypothetical protein [Bradyrhizobium sp. USDA 4353]